MAFPIVPLVAFGLSALQGVQQRAQARQLERQNNRPVYTPNSNIALNQAMARANARTGLPDQVYNNQLNQIQQNMATGLRTVNQKGNVSYNANQMVANANRAVGNLNAMDAQARQQNQNQLYAQNQAMANEQRQAFNINELQPYQQNVQNVISMRRAGTQNIFGALSQLAQFSMMGGFNGVSGQQNNPVQPPQQLQGYGMNPNLNFSFPSQLPYRNFNF